MKLSLIFVVSFAIYQSLQFDTAEANDYVFIKLKIHPDDDNYGLDVCLGVNKIKSGEVLIPKECNDDKGYLLWKFDSGNITPKEDKNLCVDTTAGEGEDLHLRACTWRYDENNNKDITPNIDKNLCVSYSDNTPIGFKTISLKKCNSKETQSWKLGVP